MTNNKDFKFLICSDCTGTGYIEKNKCPKCQGLGIVLFFEDKVLYWGKYFDSLHNLHDKLIQKVQLILNSLLVLFSVSGIIVMGYLNFSNNFVNLLSLDYWVTPSFEKIYFWLALLAGLYLYYRLEQQLSAKFNVIQKKFINLNQPQTFGDWEMVLKLKESKKIDISLAFTPDAQGAIEASWNLAKHFNHNAVSKIHLFSVLPQYDQSAIILGRLGINFNKFKEKIGRYIANHFVSRPGNPNLDKEMHQILLLAYALAYKENSTKVDLPEIILALASPELFDKQHTKQDDLAEILADLDLNYQKIKNVVAWIRIQQNLRDNLHRFKNRARFKPKSGMNKSMTAIATPLLNQFSEDLTLQALYGHFFPCVGREKEFERIFRIMEGSRQGVLLVGSVGIGRTAIVQGLAQKMVAEDVPELLQDKRLVSLDIAKLVAGVDNSIVQERLIYILKEISASKNIVLIIENIHYLTGQGSENNLDLSEIFAELFVKGSFYCLATTMPDEYAQFIENKNLDSAFQTIKVEELDVNSAIQVLEAKSGPIEYKNKVYFSYGAIEKATTLSARYIHDKCLPEKAIGIMEQSAINVRKEKGENKIVNENDIAKVVSSLTKVPVDQVGEPETQKLLNLEQKIHERIIGQDQAVDMVSASLRRARMELKQGSKPISSLLFLGPTGVGKTELAKTVAEVYFGNEKSMLRFDMSEYQEVSAISRLIGQGSNLGQLTEAVRKNPFSLILFDEIEKAHPDILNIFLQMLDDGRLTDAQGRVIDFSNSLIIMTSNAGSDFIQDQINEGKGIDIIKDVLMNEKLKEHFRPEFINRFDGVIVFKPLTIEEVIQIARLLILKITKKLQEKNIDFEIVEEALVELANQGFDPKYGARPLKRVIQEKIDDSLAKLLLEGKINRRDKIVMEVGGNLRIEKAKQI